MYLQTHIRPAYSLRQEQNIAMSSGLVNIHELLFPPILLRMPALRHCTQTMGKAALVGRANSRPPEKGGYAKWRPRRRIAKDPPCLAPPRLHGVSGASVAEPHARAWRHPGRMPGRIVRRGPHASIFSGAGRRAAGKAQSILCRTRSRRDDPSTDIQLPASFPSGRMR